MVRGKIAATRPQISGKTMPSGFESQKGVRPVEAAVRISLGNRLLNTSAVLRYGTLVRSGYHKRGIFNRDSGATRRGRR